MPLLRLTPGTVFAGDFEVVQNPSQADDARCFYVAHWPQPGLLARDPGRGTRVERVVFKGFRANLHPGLAAPEWRQALADRAIDWVADAVAYNPAGDTSGALDWNSSAAGTVTWGP